MFEGLLPEPHNSDVMNLLFTCVHWHGMAKLRMHTDDTLKILDEITAQIGSDIRAFASKTCSAFETRELHREKEKRDRRRKKKHTAASMDTDTSLAAPNVPSSSQNIRGDSSRTEHSDSTNTSDKEGRDQRRQKKFSLRTYKYHSLGDYPAMIRQFGTSDSYSTEPVSHYAT